MTKSDFYRLCGGTFFVLVSNARKPIQSKAECYNGITSGLTEPEALLALAKTVIPDISKPMNSEMKTLKDNTRDFKACLSNGGGFFRFGDQAVLKSFDVRVKQDYKQPLAAMNDFMDEFLDIKTSTKKDEYLVKGLVELLDTDKEIGNDEIFYVRADGSTMTKSQILTASELCVQPFLLGLWHYVLTVVRDNKVGKDTYKDFCPPRGGAERIYTKQLGENSKREIAITYCDIDKTDNDFTEPKEHIPGENEENRAYKENDTSSANEEAASVPGTVINNNPFFLNISGGNNSIYNHVDKVEINHEARRDKGE